MHPSRYTRGLGKDIPGSRACLSRGPAKAVRFGRSEPGFAALPLIRPEWSAGAPAAKPEFGYDGTGRVLV